MVLSNVVFVVTVLSSSSVFSQAYVQVSACLANVSCGAVAAFDLVYCSLSFLWLYLVLDVGLVAVVRSLSVCDQRGYRDKTNQTNQTNDDQSVFTANNNTT